MMKVLLLLVGLTIQFLIIMPAWFYLVRFMLKNSNAGAIEWMVFWLYVPVSIIGAIINEVARDINKKGD